MKINEKYKGIFYIILAAFGFAFMNLFVKLAGDLPAIEKSFFRNLVAVFLPFCCHEKGAYSLFYSQRQQASISSFVPFLEPSVFLQTFMRSGNSILQMHPCSISYPLSLPLSFLISY